MSTAGGIICCHRRTRSRPSGHPRLHTVMPSTSCRVSSHDVSSRRPRTGRMCEAHDRSEGLSCLSHTSRWPPVHITGARYSPPRPAQTRCFTRAYHRHSLAGSGRTRACQQSHCRMAACRGSSMTPSSARLPSLQQPRAQRAGQPVNVL